MLCGWALRRDRLPQATEGSSVTLSTELLAPLVWALSPLPSVSLRGPGLGLAWRGVAWRAGELDGTRFPSFSRELTSCFNIFAEASGTK